MELCLSKKVQAKVQLDTHSKQDKDNPPRKRNVAPTVPCVASIYFVTLYFPTAKLLVQPPSI